MAFFSFNNIKISAVACSVPTQIVKSSDYYDLFGKDSVDKFIEMTGVYEHRKALENQTASDFGYVAARKIIQEKKINVEEIGALVFGAHSFDYRRPATACVLHKRLGLSKDCVAFDVSLGCSAFVYCVQTASSLMINSDIDKALVIVGETMTKMVHPEDKASVMLFGDGGGAVLLEKTNENSKISGILKTDGCGYKAIIAPAGGFRNMYASTKTFVWNDGNKRTLYNTIMNGADVFSFTISDVPKTIKEFLEKSNTTVEDYDIFAFHQANKFIHKQLSKKIKIDFDKMPLCLDRFGNTSAPAIPLTLCDFVGTDSSDQLMNVLMCGFGVGLSWGVLSAKINKKNIYPIIETDDFFAEGIINEPKDL